MSAWSKRIPFKVDIAGIIDIMGSSLYSRPDTPIRELVQNAHDGIMRRRQLNLTHAGRIDVEQNAEAGTLSFTDDGVGLNAEDAEEYLGTLGVGITGMIKKRLRGEIEPGGGDALIGQFGIGLFSAFMLANRLVVETRRWDSTEGVRWEAGAGTDIDLSSCEREQVGTTVTLHLKPEYRQFSEQTELLETAVKEFADFLPIPIFINNGKARANVINAAWFEPTPEREAVELELEGYFSETPLDVISIRIEKPVSISGALYVTPQRTPGFADEATVAVTVRRMVISRKIQRLLPEWASFLRGVLELNDCSPTASREGLVLDENFQLVRSVLEQLIFEHFERQAREDLPRLQATIAWHRYTLAGAALGNPRLRGLLKHTYRFPTSHGQLTFQEILARSEVDPLFEDEADKVLWYNADRRQERWANSLFSGNSVPCVHALMSFEESLLATLAADETSTGQAVDVRAASPSAKGFASSILGIRDVEDAPSEWQEFLSATGAKILVASFQENQPVMAFLNERRELVRTFDELKKEGTIPAGFQRMIDAHFRGESPAENEVLLNRGHRLIGRALTQSTRSPLASVMRLLVLNALSSAGASTEREAQRQQAEDLDWIAEALWGRNP